MRCMCVLHHNPYKTGPGLAATVHLQYTYTALHDTNIYRTTIGQETDGSGILIGRRREDWDNNQSWGEWAGSDGMWDSNNVRECQENTARQPGNISCEL